jgi:putative ABC transport system substrate-binding protein
MRRREFIALLGGAALVAPRFAHAQDSTKPLRIALIGPQGIVPESSANGKMLLDALAQLGYMRGQNLIFETSADDAPRNLPPEKFIAQAKARGVDVIVVWGFPIVVAAKAAGVPTVVAFGVGDPVATGLVQSLARPGGNVTGFSNMASETAGKSVELLRDMRPSLWCVLVRAWSRNRLWSFQSNSFECMRYGSASDVWIAPPPKHAVRSRAGCAETGAEQFYFSPLYAWLGELSEQPAFVMIGK